jgi:uncharacterized membrane protein
MNTSARIPAFLAYLLLPVGWLYVFLFGRRDPAAVFHCKQSIALVAFVLAVTASWVAVGWLLAWIPFGFVLSVALFAIVIAAYLFAVVVWLVGMANALRARRTPLPIVGGWGERLPF